MATLTLTTELQDTGTRLDIYLSEASEGFSRSYAAKLIDEGRVTVDGRLVKRSYKLSGDEEIRAEIPKLQPLNVPAEDIPLDIVYEDDDVLVVNKPRGMVVHPAPGHASGRRYVAVVQGCLSEEEAVIDKAIGRDRKNRLRMAVDEERGKRAVTHYRVLERFSRYTLVECRLETGRTHQIRVHMASAGHPLLGDVLYGAAGVKWAAEGQCLHAKTIGFIHPATGEYLEFDSDLPDEMKKIIEKLRNES